MAQRDSCFELRDDSQRLEIERPDKGVCRAEIEDEANERFVYRSKSRMRGM